MSDRKYILDIGDNKPRYPWYGKKYLGDPIERANTKPWRRQMKREEKEKKRDEKRRESRKRRAFKTVAGQIVTGNKLTCSIVAQLKGKLLVKCELPKELQHESNEILGWVLPVERKHFQGKAKVSPAKIMSTEVEPPDVLNIKHLENPYAEFLDTIGDFEEEESGGLMGGLKSWLGFAGSMTGTGAAVLSEPQAAKPWTKGQKTGEDAMTKKAEEHMNKIAGDFCNWLRELPGDDKKVNELGETHLRSLFDTAQSANPGTTKLAEGLRSWVKFGSSVTGAEQTKRNTVEKAKPLLNQKRFVEKLLGIKGGLKSKHLEPKIPRVESCRDRRFYYGAWYVEPEQWEGRYGRQVQTSGGGNIEDKTKLKLKANLPGAVDMMGFQQPVSQLQATKAFGQYLNEKKNYKKPVFINYILNYSEKEKS